MELIKPDGTEVKAAESQEKKEEVKPALHADFTKPGWMVLEVNLAYLSNKVAFMDQFIGFMERHKGLGLELIGRMIAQREQVNADINKQNHRGFISKIMNRRGGR